MLTWTKAPWLRRVMFEGQWPLAFQWVKIEFSNVCKHTDNKPTYTFSSHPPTLPKTRWRHLILRQDREKCIDFWFVKISQISSNGGLRGVLHRGLDFFSFHFSWRFSCKKVRTTWELHWLKPLKMMIFDQLTEFGQYGIMHTKTRVIGGGWVGWPHREGVLLGLLGSGRGQGIFPNLFFG